MPLGTPLQVPSGHSRSRGAPGLQLPGMCTEVAIRLHCCSRILSFHPLVFPPQVPRFGKLGRANIQGKGSF